MSLQLNPLVPLPVGKRCGVGGLADSKQPLNNLPAQEFNWNGGLTASPAAPGALPRKTRPRSSATVPRSQPKPPMPSMRRSFAR